MRPQFKFWTAQVWDRDERLVNVEGLSYDAAKEVGLASRLNRKHVTRLMCEELDYCEVYGPGEEYRCGTFGKTVMVSE